jgi:hypothetical protein
MVGSEAVMRASEVTLPSLTGNVEIGADEDALACKVEISETFESHDEIRKSAGGRRLHDACVVPAPVGRL